MTGILSNSLRVAGLAAAALAVNTSAFAHHPMGGETPATFLQGFLSGIGHPIIGLDHLAFVVGVGLLSMLCAHRFLMPAIFILATMVGTGIHLAGIGLPLAELVIATSVMAAGVLLIVQRNGHPAIIGGLFAVAGCFHGHAYGEAVFGAEATPVAAYLIGFGLIQYGVAVGAMEGMRRLITADVRQQAWLRVSGGAIAGVAFVFMSEQLMPF